MQIIVDAKGGVRVRNDQKAAGGDDHALRLLRVSRKRHRLNNLSLRSDLDEGLLGAGDHHIVAG